VGFYLTVQVQAYPSRSLGLPSRCLFSIEKRGKPGGGRHRLGLPHQRQTALPNDVFLGGPQTALIMPFESQRAGCCSQGDIRAEGYAFIGLALRGKELAKGLSHATARLGFAPHGGLGHLVDTFLSIACATPQWEHKGCALPSPRVAMSPHLPGGNRRRSDLSSLYSLHV
jgi:hypothetical protein